MASDGLRHESLDSETQLGGLSLQLQLPQTSTFVFPLVSPTPPAEGEQRPAKQNLPNK